MENIQGQSAPGRGTGWGERRYALRGMEKLFQAGKMDGERYKEALVRFSIIPDAAEWGLFFKRLLTQVGILLILAGALMFLAWNWQAMPKWMKFGVFETAFVVFVAASIYKWKHWVGDLSLLGAAIICGALLALFGQIYQTGADAWELFRAWTLAIIPFFFLRRTEALGFLLWLVGSLWCGLYLMQMGDVFRDDSLSFYNTWTRFSQMQCACWILCEVLHSLSAPGGKLSFLGEFDSKHILTKLIGTAVLASLTIQLSFYIFVSDEYHGYTSSHSIILYAAVLAAVYGVYFKLKPDLFFLAMSVFSAAWLSASFIIRVLFDNFRFDGLAVIFLAGIFIIGIFIIAGLSILRIRSVLMSGRERLVPIPKTNVLLDGLTPWIEKHCGMTGDEIRTFLAKERKEQENEYPWYLKLPMVIGIWIGALVLVLFMALALDGSIGGFTAIGVMFCIAGAGFFSTETFVLRQMGLTGIICGIVLAGFLFTENPVHGFMLYTVIFLCLWFALRVTVAKIISFAAALWSFLLFWVPDLFYRHNYYYAVPETPACGFEFLPAMFILGFSVAVFIVVSSLASRRVTGKTGEYVKSAANGALLFVMLYTLVANSRSFLFGLSEIITPVSAPSCISIGILVGSIVAFMLSLSNGSRRIAPKLAVLAGGLALAGLGELSPLVSLGLLLIAYARRGSNFFLGGLAVLYLAVGVTFFYYNLNMPFLEKSEVMLASGAGLVAAALLVQLVLSKLRPGGASALPDKAESREVR